MTMETSAVEYDESHTWGRYREVAVEPNVLIRIIEFAKGGRTSVHRHDAITETLTVVAGKIRFFYGEQSGSLTDIVLGPGGVIVIDAGLWHAAECVQESSPGAGYALAIEYATGEMLEGTYEIIRAVSAIPAQPRN